MAQIWLWLWLWRRPEAIAPIRSLAWEPPYVAGAAQKKKKKKKKKKIQWEDTRDFEAREWQDLTDV